MARLIQVIETDDLRGLGTPASPYRRVKQHWSVDGELLMERDDWQAEYDRNRAVEPTVKVND